MPIRRFRKSNRPRRPRRRVGRKVRKGPRMPVIADKGQYATIIETIAFTDVSANDVEYNSFTLSEFPRALGLAQNFAFYKADKVIWTYEPLYNTFQDSAGGISKPYLYMVMNRRQRTMTNETLSNIQAMGAQPLTLTSRKEISYRPNWTSPGLTFHAANTQPSNTYTQGAKVQYAWLQTQPGLPSPISGQPSGGNAAPYGDYMMGASALYNGHIAYVEQAVAPTLTRVAKLTCTVHWKFKGAVFDQAPTTAPVPDLKL